MGPKANPIQTGQRPAGNVAGLKMEAVRERFRSTSPQTVTGAGHVDVDELARTLLVSPSTIRRDLNFLAEQQLLSRTHGGAVGTTVNYDLPVRYRRTATSHAPCTAS